MSDTDKVTEEIELDAEKEYAGSVGSVIEFDDKTGEVKITPINEGQTDEVTNDERADEPEESTKVDANVEADKEIQRKSRAKERISQLVSENKKLALEKEEKEKLLNETNAAFAKRMVDSLKREMDALRKQRTEAITEQDGESLNEIDDRMASLRDEIKEYSSFVVEPVKQENGPVKQTSSLPEAAERWAEGKEYLLHNDEYIKIPREYRVKVALLRDKLRTIADGLIKEGFSPEQDYFYEEVDIRMSNAFPFYEALASEGLDALKSGKDTTSSGETEKPRVVIQPAKTPSEKSKSVPVRGSQTASSTTETSSKRKIVLSKEEVSFWDRHLKHNGISLEDYAKRKIQIEGTKG